jgi:hypothetical protein
MSLAESACVSTHGGFLGSCGSFPRLSTPFCLNSLLSTSGGRKGVGLADAQVCTKPTKGPKAGGPTPPKTIPSKPDVQAREATDTLQR